MEKEILERICFNCNFFLSSRPGFSEYGICLEDKDFDPFIDELLENLNYSCCEALLREKEFPGDRDACNLYEEAEIIEIDNDDFQPYTETTDILSEPHREGDLSMDLTTDEWWKHYREVDDDKKFDYLKKVLASGETAACPPDSELGEAVVSMFGNLYRRKLYGQLLELENLIYSRENGIPNSDRHYIDYYCLGYHLFKSDIASIQRSLQSFIADPEESIDLLIPLHDTLNYYGYGELAVQVCQDVYNRIRDSDRLIGGAEEDFARTIIMSEFQKLYQLKGKATLAYREELFSRLVLYNYLDKDELNPVINYLLNDTNCSNLNYDDFEVNAQDFYDALSTGFIKYVFEEKGINFPTAYDIWMGAWSCFCKEAAKDTGGLERFFELDESSFDDYIGDRFAFLSNKKPHAAAVLWGIPYVYDFLKMNQLIPEEVAFNALQYITWMKMNLIDGQEDSICAYSFVHSWGKPDSIEEEDFLKEKIFFERAFTEIVDVKDYLPADFFKSKKRTLERKWNESVVKHNEPKTGRNELCPCGSKKKYKKCCGR